MNSVEQGRTFSYIVQLTGDGAESFTAETNVLQYPGDNPAISRVVEYSCQDDGCGYIGTLTAADTAALDVGQWTIHVNMVDADENLAEPIKLYVTKGWVS